MLILVVISAAWHRSCAQVVNGTLLGTVTDSKGGVVVGGKVTASEISTGATHETTTNESGNFTFPDMLPGNYNVTIEASGFKSATQEKVDLISNSATRVDFTLQLGRVSETVVVTTAPPLLQTDRADVSTKLESEKLEDLPLTVNRNFQSLLNLVPGAAPAVFQHSQFFNAQSTIQTEVDGLPRFTNNYQIEGIDDNERTGALQILIPPADAIKTVDISTGNYEAELGRAVGAVTNVTLKSGSNMWHGSASEYLQNSAMNARSYFSSSVGHLAYNYFGGNLSGPIQKDKLFFYADYFRTSDHEANANTMTIPYKATTTCNGSGYYDLSAGYTPNGKGQIYDPATGTSSGAGRTPFAGNLIPCSRVNPVAAALLNLLPAPNSNLNPSNPSNNYFITLPFQKAADNYDTKIDYVLSSMDRLSFRFNYLKNNVFQAPSFGPEGGGPAQGAFEGTGTNNAYSTGLNYDHIFSPTLMTEVRVGISHYGNVADPNDFGSNDATKIGVPGVNLNPLTSGQVGINLNDFSAPIIGYAASEPWIRGESNVDVANHWTKVAGNHTFKVGGELRRIHDSLLQGLTYGPRGAYTFAEDQTGLLGGPATDFHNAIASMLLDQPSGAGRDLFTYFPRYRQWWVFLYAADKWQATSKLTLDYGLRWEFYPPATPASRGGFSNYNPSTFSLIVAGVGGNPSNLGMTTRYDYFAPRTGAAYRLTEKTVIRAGFGMSYAPWGDTAYAYNYPVRANNAYTSPNSYTPAVLADNVTPATFQAGFPAPAPIPVPSSGIYNIGSNPVLSAQSYTVVATNYYNPYVMSWNATVQQALPGNFSLQIGYVANHGAHISANQNVNLPGTFGGGSASEPGYNIPGSTLHHTAADQQYFFGTSTNFESMQVQLNHRMTNGFATSTAFTWGKGLGYFSSDDSGYDFWQDVRRNYAPMDFDRRINIEEAFTYELPFGTGRRFMKQGLAGKVVGGWDLSGVISIVSGMPFTVTANGGTLNTPGWTQTANLTGKHRVLHGKPGANWFDPTVFGQPAGCPAAPAACTEIIGQTVGNTGRNQFYGPGYIQDNFSLVKNFPITERVRSEFRVDAIQLSNTPQFANPSASITSTTFGQITGTLGSGTGVNGVGGGRSLQLAAIVRF
jgi:hypothetical protein